MVHELTRTQARRVAVAAQLLAGDTATQTGVLDTLRHLTLLQNDPVAAVAPSAHLVLWSRLGPSYRPSELERLITAGAVVELDMLLRPAEDLALYRAEMAAWPGVAAAGGSDDWRQSLRHWVEANDHSRREILDKLYDEGPLPASALPDTTVIPWQSSGWNDNRSLRKLLDCLVGRGEVAAAGFEGRERLWDLAERVYPDLPVVPLQEALTRRNARRLHALGVARATATATPTDANHVGEAGEPAVIEGVKGRWRVEPSYLSLIDACPGRAALLSPLDRLVYDRKRMAELFEFDYQLEMFKPAAKRRWGYWAMPVLVGDRLIGKLDATTRRDLGVLSVAAVHEDHPWDAATRALVGAELESLASWLDLELAMP